MKKWLRVPEFWIASALVLLLALCTWADGAQQTLASQLTRLQIVANSDSPEDQAVKLQVRDCVLAMTEQITEDCTCAAEAREALASALQEITEAAQDTVYAAGKTTPVTARLAEIAYPGRDYGSFALPAGVYTALRVELGEAKGHNWWCVAFPSLCTAAAEAVPERAQEGGVSDEDARWITEGKTGVRFWIVDRVERLLNWWRA